MGTVWAPNIGHIKWMTLRFLLIIYRWKVVNKWYKRVCLVDFLCANFLAQIILIPPSCIKLALLQKMMQTEVHLVKHLRCSFLRK